MKDNRGASVSIPPKLSVVALLSCSLTIVVSVVYVTLCSLAIHVRLHCNAWAGSPSDPGSTYFMTTLLRLYFKQVECTHALILPDVTQEKTVFLLACITLAVSGACLLVAVGFITVLKIEKGMVYVEPFGYCYVAIILVSIANDLATGVHFGMDFTTFTQQVNNSSPGVSVNYAADMYRLGALLLVAVSLKGFMVHILNVVFVVLLVVYLVDLRRQIESQEHSIHKVGALKAYDQTRRMDEHSESSFQHFRTEPKRNDDPWQNTSESTYAPYRPQMNPMFGNDEETPRILNHREPPRSAYTNPSFDRSYSWHHNQPSLASRPFSYLEDNKRQAPLKAPSPNKEPQWQHDPWDAQAPPVPAPDYSPETPRRLKSALKSSYM